MEARIKAAQIAAVPNCCSLDIEGPDLGIPAACRYWRGAICAACNASLHIRTHKECLARPHVRLHGHA